MKHGWEYKKLGEVCGIQYGYAFDSTLFNEDKEGLPLVRIRDVVRGFSETYFRGEFADDYVVRRGDYLIGMDGEFNIAQWQSEDALLNQRVCRIFSKDSRQLVMQFLYYFLTRQLKEIEDETPFVTVKHLSAKKINQIIAPVPALAVQERIVGELDKVREVIEKKKEQLKELDNLAQSIFYDMFGDPVENEKGWEVKKMGEECSELRYGTSRPAVENGKYGYLRMGNLTISGHLDLSDLKYIDIPENEIEKCLVKKGDVMFNRTNSLDLIGKTCMFDLDEPMVIAGYIIRVRLRPTLYPRYVVSMFNTPTMKKVLRKMAKGAVNQANINSKELSSIAIPLPPLPLQQAFAEKVETIEKQKELINQSIKEAQLLFDSRMEYWFGE